MKHCVNQHNISLLLLERYALAIICLQTSGGLRKSSMFLPEIALDSTSIHLAPGNQEDDVLFQVKDTGLLRLFVVPIVKL